MNIHVSKTPRREIGPKLLKPPVQYYLVPMHFTSGGHGERLYEAIQKSSPANFIPVDEMPHSFEKFVFWENTEQGKAALAKMEQHFQPTAPSHRDKHIEEG